MTREKKLYPPLCDRSARLRLGPTRLDSYCKLTCVRIKPPFLSWHCTVACKLNKGHFHPMFHKLTQASYLLRINGTCVHSWFRVQKFVCQFISISLHPSLYLPDTQVESFLCISFILVGVPHYSRGTRSPCKRKPDRLTGSASKLYNEYHIVTNQVYETNIIQFVKG